jgi:hypothetical protein
MSVDTSDPSMISLLSRLNKIFETETYKYSYNDFEREMISDKNKLFLLLERINNIHNKATRNKNELNHIYSEMNTKLENYVITEIFNIKCERALKYKNRNDLPIQLYEGYYYSFTVSYREK